MIPALHPRDNDTPRHLAGCEALRSVAGSVVLAQRVAAFPTETVAPGTVCRAFVVLDAMREQLLEVERARALLAADIRNTQFEAAGGNEPLLKLRDRARVAAGVPVQMSALTRKAAQ